MSGPNRRAFTMVEMLMVVGLIAMVAVIAAPAFRNEHTLRLRAGVDILTSDLEAAQMMAITTPAASIVVRFDPADGSYWLALADTPDTPLPRPPFGAPYLVRFGAGRALSAAGVSLALVDMPDATLHYESHGGLEDFTTKPKVELELDGHRVRIAISPATGSITHEELSP